MSEKIQPSSDPRSTAIAVAYALLKETGRLDRLKPDEAALLVGRTAKTLLTETDQGSSTQTAP